MLPFMCLLPYQFYRNMYISLPFWIVVFTALLLFPKTFQLAQEIKLEITPVLILWVIYLVSLALSCFFSTNISISWPILWLNLAYFVIFLTSGRVLYSQASKEGFATIFLSVVAILSIISFYNTLILGYINLESEGLSFMWGYFGHNHIAPLLILAIPLSTYFIRFQKSNFTRALLMILLVFYIYSLLIAFSRSAVLALILAITLAAIVFINTYKNLLNKNRYLFLGCVILLLVLSSWIIVERKSLKSVYIRSQIAEKGIGMFLERPVIGYGPGTFGFTKTNPHNPEKVPFYPHNLIIQSLAEGGIVVFLSMILLYLLLIMDIVFKIERFNDKKTKFFSMTLWVGVVALLTNEIADFDLQLPSIGMIFWLIGGLIYFESVFQERLIRRS